MATNSQQCVDELLLKQIELDKIICKFDKAEGHSLSETKDLYVQAKKLVKNVQDYIDNNKEIIPAYCLKRASDALRILEAHIDKPNRTNIQFKFSSKPKGTLSPPKPETSNSSSSIEKNQTDENAEKVQSANTVRDKDELAETLDDYDESTESYKSIVEEREKPRPIQIITNTYGFSNRKHEFLTLTPEQVKGRDISLVNLERCDVVIHGVANTVYIKNVWHSDIIVCLATRSIKISDCYKCKLKLVCQQLRIDTSCMMMFDNFISARTMFESSEDLEFKRLDLNNIYPSWNYDQVKNLLLEAEFDETKNNWKLIDDFDHLCRNTPSKSFVISE